MKSITIPFILLLSSCSTGYTFSEFSGIENGNVTVCLVENKQGTKFAQVEGSCKNLDIQPILSKKGIKTDHMRSLIRDGDKTFIILRDDGKIFITNPGLAIISMKSRKVDEMDFGIEFYEKFSRLYTEK